MSVAAPVAQWYQVWAGVMVLKESARAGSAVACSADNPRLICNCYNIELVFQTVDHSARVSMKNAASCDKFCELQTHRTLIFRTDIPALDFTFSATSVRGSSTYHGSGP